MIVRRVGFKRFILFLALLAAVVAAHLHQPVYAQQTVGVGVGDTVLDISGKSAPNSFITVYAGPSLISSFSADTTGSFTRSIPAQTPGITRLSVSATDLSGRPSDAVTLEVNLQQHFHTAVFFFLPTTLDISPFAITGDQQLTASGQTIPGGTVSIYIDGSVRGTVTADSAGDWEYKTKTADLSGGSHEIFARVTDSLGTQSFPTRSQTFTVARPQPPVLPIPTTPPLVPIIIRSAPSEPIVTSPTNKQIFTQSRVTISGSAPARTQVEVWEGSQIIGSVWSDTAGVWALPYTFTPGDHTIHARSCQNGQCGKFSNSVTFTFRSATTPASRLRAKLDTYRFNTVPAGKKGEVVLRLRITEGSPPFQATINWGDGFRESFTRTARDLEFKHSYSKEGRYSGRVLIRNSLGQQELLFSVDIQTAPVAAIRPAFVVMLLGCIVPLVIYIAVKIILKRRAARRL